MRVAYDWGPLLDAPTGVGRYTRELASSLEARGVELLRYAISLRGVHADNVARWKVPARVVQESWRRFGRPTIDGLVPGADVVHATNFVLPVTKRIPGVVTVHDLSFYRDDAFPGSRRLEKLVPWSIERAARVLVPTHAIAHEIAERWPDAVGKLRVTPEGVPASFFTSTPLSDATLAGMGIRRPFALAAGTIEPRKNLARLLAAWQAAAGALRGWSLVLAGPKGWGPSLPETPGVVPIGWVGDETLPGLLRAADLFCFPSLYEGFGLPPLEAMAAGTPVLAGRCPATEEVVGDAALLVEPTEVESIAIALARLVEDDPLRQRLARSGRARAIAFSWDRSAAETLTAYRETLEVG